MRLNATNPGSQHSDEKRIRDQIHALQALLQRPEPEPRTPLDVLIVKTFSDGATHSQSRDVNNEWGRIGRGIRECLRQGGEVSLRPLDPKQEFQEQKYYPSRERIKELEEFVGRIVRLNRDAGEMGAGMLAQLVDDARWLMKGKEGQ